MAKPWLVVWLAALLLLAARGGAAAGPEDEAKQAFLEGAAAFERGQLRAALKHYTRSLALVENPRTLFNIAVCEQELRMFEAAYRDFNAFLRKAQERDADLVAEAQRRLREIAGQLAPGRITIQTRPPGAQVFVDDERVARGSAPLTVPLRPGRHRVRAVQRGMLPVEREIEVAPGAARVEQMALEQLSIIVVTTVPADAAIRPAQTPRTVATGRLRMEVLHGTHEFHISRPGYEPQTVEVEVPPGETVTRQVVLSRGAQRATLSIRSNVAGASISLDGLVIASVAQTPTGPAVIAREVPPGEHLLVAERSGYRAVATRVQVARGQHVEVALSLRAESSGPSPLVWTVAGVGAASFVTGAVFGVLALRDDSNQVGQRAVDRAHAADVLMGAGLVAGGVAWLLHRRERNAESTASVRVRAGSPDRAVSAVRRRVSAEAIQGSASGSPLCSAAHRCGSLSP